MAHLGLVGIGVMGGAFALNLAEKGHSVSLLDRSLEKPEKIVAKGKAENLSGDLTAFDDVKKFVATLPRPRSILVLVPSGKPLDSVIDMLTPLLDKGDLIADLGNSYYHNTEARVAACEAKGLQFLGIGISGGADGARHGPSIMAGGSAASWAQVKQPLQDAAAKFDGTPCCDWFGPGGAGHFIKMLHNGIEYADMQQIAEAYGIMRDGLGMQASEIADVFASWMDGPLNSYLIDIAAKVAAARDPLGKGAMLDAILDKAGQKGTGRWSVIEALHMGSPASMMQAAVEARNISAARDERLEMERVFGASPHPIPGDRSAILAQLEQAMIAAKVCVYVQGFEVLDKASTAFDWSLDLAAIARVWRAGCIIRSVFLDEIADVFDAGGSANLSLAPVFRDRLIETTPALRQIVGLGIAYGQSVPALYAALGFFDMRRTGRGTANMIQGLRDYFGAHTFERLDNPGKKLNGPWHNNS